jgi:endonuclease/exonuclease/phosphatase family metal-dependent hydrolase
MLRKTVIAFVLGLLVVRAAPAQPPDASVPVIDWKDAAKHKGKEVVVQGKIAVTRNIGRICFLNFDQDRNFTVIIRQANYKNFSTPPERMYDQKIIRVHGKIAEFRGKPQIEVTKPDQVTILEKELPLSAGATPATETAVEPANGIVTIAAFNVLNLFDAHDDPYTIDESTPAKPKEELDRVAATIRELKADVVAMEEVENRGCLEAFVKNKLGGMGYEYVVQFEGNDERGIDCALISRFPIGPVTSYRHLRFNDNEGKPTHFQRDFLRVRIEPRTCAPFDIFLVHFKSKRDGASTTEHIRVAECQQARHILNDILKLQTGALFLVCGDFNDTWDSLPLKTIRGTGSTALQGFVKDLPPGARSYNKGQHADVIDFILASPALAKRYVPKSYKLNLGSVETLGSDHNPITAQFDLSKP